MSSKLNGTEKLSLDLSFFKKPKATLIFTLIGVVFYQISNILRPNYGNLKILFEGHIFAYFKDLVGYYLCFEWISAFIFLNGMYYYYKLLGIKSFDKSSSGYLRIIGLYFPYCFISIFLFAPITNGLRYVLYQRQLFTWAEYFPEYFMTVKMYTRYLVPSMTVGFVYLIHELFIRNIAYEKEKGIDKVQILKTDISRSLSRIVEIHTVKGISPIDISQIQYIEKQTYKTLLVTDNQSHFTNLTLKDLLALIDNPDVIPINKSTLINIKKLINFTYIGSNKYHFEVFDRKFDVRYERYKLLKEQGLLAGK